MTRKRQEWLKDIFERLGVLSAWVKRQGINSALFRDNMVTIRKQYHDIGSKLHSSVFTIGAIKDALGTLVCREEDEDLQQELVKNCEAVEESLMELKRQIGIIKSWAYRMADPEALIGNSDCKKFVREEAVRLLFVDDDESICNVFAEAYCRKGFCVETAYNKADALSRVREFLPHIAVIDLYLHEGKEGESVLRHIKESFPEIKTIVITYEDQAVELQGVKVLQPDELLLKPVRSKILDGKINSMVNVLRG